jgi:hypothetical protein
MVTILSAKLGPIPCYTLGSEIIVLCRMARDTAAKGHPKMRTNGRTTDEMFLLQDLAERVEASASRFWYHPVQGSYACCSTGFKLMQLSRRVLFASPIIGSCNDYSPRPKKIRKDCVLAENWVFSCILSSW